MGGIMKYNIRIEENVKDESYYVYGWGPLLTIKSLTNIR